MELAQLLTSCSAWALQRLPSLASISQNTASPIFFYLNQVAQPGCSCGIIAIAGRSHYDSQRRAAAIALENELALAAAD